MLISVHVKNLALIDEVDSVLIDEARTPLIISGQSSKSTKLYEVEKAIEKYESKIQEVSAEKPYYYLEGEEHPCWRKDIYESPQSLNFWFDFLDSDGELYQFSASNVGRRPKVINDTNVKAIHYKAVPSIIFKNPE